MAEGASVGQNGLSAINGAAAPSIPIEHIVLFYHYFAADHILDDAERSGLLEFLNKTCASLNMRGRLLVSKQGLNGTMSTPSREDMEAFKLELMAWAHPRDSGAHPFSSVDWKQSAVESKVSPFPDMLIKPVKELVASGGMPYDVNAADTGIGSDSNDVEASGGGKHLSPLEFHETLATTDPEDLVIIDVRNRFEHAIGHFVDKKGQPAMDPNMRNFSQFRHFVDALPADTLRGKKVLMYCTGGIRCETASCYVRSKGLAAEVCQLSGGIHRYCEQFGAGGFFHGKNFVFDSRVAIAASEVKLPAPASTSEGSISAAPPTASSDASLDSSDTNGMTTESAARAEPMGLRRTGGLGALAGSELTARPQGRLQKVKAMRLSQPSATARSTDDVVGVCSECGTHFDELSGGVVCTVCVCLVLVCHNCRRNGAPMTSRHALGAEGGGADSAENDTSVRRFEWYCKEHTYLKGSFLTFLDFYDEEDLQRQRQEILDLLERSDQRLELRDGKSGDTLAEQLPSPAAEVAPKRGLSRVGGFGKHAGTSFGNGLNKFSTKRQIRAKRTFANDPRQRVLTLYRQLKKLDDKLAQLAASRTTAPVTIDRSAGLPCRCCLKQGCDGHCWGVWKTKSGPNRNMMMC